MSGNERLKTHATLQPERSWVWQASRAAMPPTCQGQEGCDSSACHREFWFTVLGISQPGRVIAAGLVLLALV